MAKQVKGARAFKPNDSFGVINNPNLYKNKYREEVDKDDEDELATATREVGEEMGIDVEIAGEIPGWYNTDNSTSKYFLMRMTKDNNKPDEPAHDWETEKIVVEAFVYKIVEDKVNIGYIKEDMTEPEFAIEI